MIPHSSKKKKLASVRLEEGTISLNGLYGEAQLERDIQFTNLTIEKGAGNFHLSM